MKVTVFDLLFVLFVALKFTIRPDLSLIVIFSPYLVIMFTAFLLIIINKYTKL